MDENSVTETQMDAHLARVQREAKSTLDKLSKSGIKVTKPLVDYFYKVTCEQLRLTCERYNPEARWKIPCITSEPTEECDQKVLSDMDQSKNEMKSNLVEVEQPKLTNEKRERKRRNNSPVNNEQSNRAKTINNDEIKKSTTYYSCVYCRSQNDFSGVNSFSGTIDIVYDHWLAKHANEAISKPFQFNAVVSVVCLHCNDSGSYHELVEHHKAKHPSQQFGIVKHHRDRKTCGVCHFNDGDLIEHFKEKHDLNDVQVSMIFNPIRYSEKRIAKLMKINVHKKRQCKVCKEIFETHGEIVKHFTNSHNGQFVQSKEFTDNRNTPAYLICGYCNKMINCTKFVNHFRDHTYNFNCTQCPKKSGDIAEMIYHENIVHNIDSTIKRCEAFKEYVKPRFLNTNIVFDNGLTLKMYNVLETKFDDSKLIAMFIDRFLDLMKDQAKKIIELNRANESQTQNHQTQSFPISSNGWLIPKIEPNDHSQAAVISTTTIPQLYSPQSPPQIDSAIPIHIMELYEQQQLAKNVYISGLSSDVHTQNPLVVFLKYCRELGIFMPRKNIEDVFERHNGIIVKFHQIDTKESFMSQTRCIRSNGQFPNGQGTRMINVQHHMTPYYYHIFREAIKLKRRHLLHSYNLYKNGFLIRITANSAEHTVQSTLQLMDLFRS